MRSPGDGSNSNSRFPPFHSLQIGVTRFLPTLFVIFLTSRIFLLPKVPAARLPANSVQIPVVLSSFPIPITSKFFPSSFQADSVLFASPDYNYSVTAPLKNAIDWGSRPPNVWADKAAALVGAAGGTGGALQQYHVRQIGVFLNLHFINKPEFFLRRPLVPPQKCDEDGNLIDGEVRERLTEVLLSLYAFTLRLQGKSK
ncbi:NADPH:quinone oxidoreductase-like [Coffea eugenioides]|uniref:NADPH:quinone oxidoreductase-like n=1 Tax=Coffea eugenioides TaxID=49369 RepID=UPI000F6113AE|nr:NADPH:quinone oxidoreductase-like [Coffea eugenioides]